MTDAGEEPPEKGRKGEDDEHVVSGAAQAADKNDVDGSRSAATTIKESKREDEKFEETEDADVALKAGTSKRHDHGGPGAKKHHDDVQKKETATQHPVEDEKASKESAKGPHHRDGRWMHGVFLAEDSAEDLWSGVDGAKKQLLSSIKHQRGKHQRGKRGSSSTPRQGSSREVESATSREQDNKHDPREDEPDNPDTSAKSGADDGSPFQDGEHDAREGEQDDTPPPSSPKSGAKEHPAGEHSHTHQNKHAAKERRHQNKHAAKNAPTSSSSEKHRQLVDINDEDRLNERRAALHEKVRWLSSVGQGDSEAARKSRQDLRDLDRKLENGGRDRSATSGGETTENAGGAKQEKTSSQESQEKSSETTASASKRSTKAESHAENSESHEIHHLSEKEDGGQSDSKNADSLIPRMRTRKSPSRGQSDSKNADAKEPEALNTQQHDDDETENKEELRRRSHSVKANGVGPYPLDGELPPGTPAERVGKDGKVEDSGSRDGGRSSSSSSGGHAAAAGLAEKPRPTPTKAAAHAAQEESEPSPEEDEDDPVKTLAMQLAAAEKKVAAKKVKDQVQDRSRHQSPAGVVEDAAAHASPKNFLGASSSSFLSEAELVHDDHDAQQKSQKSKIEVGSTKDGGASSSPSPKQDEHVRQKSGNATASSSSESTTTSNTTSTISASDAPTKTPMPSPLQQQSSSAHSSADNATRTSAAPSVSSATQEATKLNASQPKSPLTPDVSSAANTTWSTAPGIYTSVFRTTQSAAFF